MAVRNGNDGVSLIQTAEAAMIEQSAILQRMRELTVQSLNDTNSAEQRTYLDQEFQQLKAELNNIATTTVWNGTPILNLQTAAKYPVVQATENFTDFCVEGYASENLTLHEDSAVSTTADAISVVNGQVYKGTGDNYKLIGTVDPLLNGKSGQAVIPPRNHRGEK